MNAGCVWPAAVTAAAAAAASVHAPNPTERCFLTDACQQCDFTTTAFQYWIVISIEEKCFFLLLVVSNVNSILTPQMYAEEAWQIQLSQVTRKHTGYWVKTAWASLDLTAQPPERCAISFTVRQKALPHCTENLTILYDGCDKANERV